MASLSKDYSRLATSAYRDLRINIFSLKNEQAGKLLRILHGPKRSICCIAFSRKDSSIIAAGDESGLTCIWQLSEEETFVAPLEQTKANLPW